MSSIDTYLAELERRLKKAVPEDVAEARLREVRSHLAAAAQEAGEATALRRFGTPAATARSIVRQARAYDRQSLASLSLVPGLVICVAIVGSGLWMAYAMDPLAMLAAVWIPFLATLFFAFRCFQTRRWLALPSGVWGALGIAGYFLISGLYPARLDLGGQDKAQAIESAKHAIAVCDKDLGEIQAWRRGNPPTDKVPRPSTVSTTSYMLGLPFGIHVAGAPVYSVERVSLGQTRSAEAWNAYGEAWARTVRVQRKAAVDYLAGVRKGSPVIKIPVNARVLFALKGSIQFWLVLFAYNALALVAGRIIDSLPTRTRPRRLPQT